MEEPYGCFQRMSLIKVAGCQQGGSQCDIVFKNRNEPKLSSDMITEICIHVFIY